MAPRKKKMRGPSKVVRRWPFDPIDDYMIGTLGASEPLGLAQPNVGDGNGASAMNIARRLGTTRDMIFNHRKLGLSDTKAEQFAHQLGVDPVCLWPDWYETVDVPADLDAEIEADLVHNQRLLEAS